MLTPPHPEQPWRKVGNAAVVLAALTCDFAHQSRTACAQENNSPKTADTEHPKKWSLLIRSRWADIDVCLGQIQTTCIESAQSRIATSGTPGEGSFEKLTIANDTDTPSVFYHVEDERKDIDISVINGNHVTMTQSSNNPQIPPISFHQQSLGKILLHIGQGDALQKYSATSIWHLLLREPEICRQHLIPLLDILIADHHLMEDASQMEKGLWEKAGQPHISIDTMRRLIFQMGNEKYDIRKHAMSQFDGLGIQALPFLESLDVMTLNRDQSDGVLRVIRTIKEKYRKNPDVGSQKDSVERALLWLFEDPEIWSIFLQRTDPGQHAIALRELQAMFPAKTEQELMRKFCLTGLHERR